MLIRPRLLGGVSLIQQQRTSPLLLGNQGVDFLQNILIRDGEGEFFHARRLGAQFGSSSHWCPLLADPSGGVQTASLPRVSCLHIARDMANESPNS